MRKTSTAFLSSFPLMFMMYFCLILPGCLRPFAQTKSVKHYMPEYESPAAEESAPLPYVLKVKLFSAAPPYRSAKIIYSDEKFKREAYNYHKWRSEPDVVVTYLLTRDLRNSSLFSGVFYYEEEATGSHSIFGTVDDFYELDGHDGWKAIFGVSVTLLAENDPGVGRKVCFQKSYRAEKDCRKKNPHALAEAMSLAISSVSKKISSDIYNCLKNNKLIKNHGMTK